MRRLFGIIPCSLYFRIAVSVKKRNSVLLLGVISVSDIAVEKVFGTLQQVRVNFRFCSGMSKFVSDFIDIAKYLACIFGQTQIIGNREFDTESQLRAV